MLAPPPDAFRDRERIGERVLSGTRELRAAAPLPHRFERVPGDERIFRAFVNQVAHDFRTVCAVASSGLLAALTRLARLRNSGDMIGGPGTRVGIVQDGEDMPAFYGN